jgi:hypothetical protein
LVVEIGINRMYYIYLAMMEMVGSGSPGEWSLLWMEFT